MKRFEMQIDTAHAVLFLGDSSPNVAIPMNPDEAPVVQTADCIAFNVLHYVDGVSIVTISDQICTAGVKLFSGSILATTGILSLTDSGAFSYINVPVPSGSVDIDVWMSKAQHPEWVWIKLGEIESL